MRVKLNEAFVSFSDRQGQAIENYRSAYFKKDLSVLPV